MDNFWGEKVFVKGLMLNLNIVEIFTSEHNRLNPSNRPYSIYLPHCPSVLAMMLMMMRERRLS